MLTNSIIVLTNSIIVLTDIIIVLTNSIIVLTNSIIVLTKLIVFGGTRGGEADVFARVGVEVLRGPQELWLRDAFRS